jgi:hypothetical protein
LQNQKAAGQAAFFHVNGAGENPGQKPEPIAGFMFVSLENPFTNETPTYGAGLALPGAWTNYYF